MSTREIELLYESRGFLPADLVAVLRSEDDELFYVIVKQCISVTRKIARNGNHYWIFREANRTRRPCMIIFEDRMLETPAFWQTNGSEWHVFLENMPTDATYGFRFQIIMEGFHKGGFDDGYLLEGFLKPPPTPSEYASWYER